MIGNLKSAHLYWALLFWVLTAVSFPTSQYNYLLFHYLAETFSIVVASGIFIIAWNTRGQLNNNYLLVTGIAYLFVAILDAMHTLSYKGMQIFTGYDADLPTQLWIAARYLESISLLIPLFLLRKKLNSYLLFSIYLLVSIFLIFIIFNGTFPYCYIEGYGLTEFKIASEYIISFIVLLAIFLLLKNKRHFETHVLQYVIAALIFTILAELAFTFYVSVYGISNFIGHIFKIISFCMIYSALIRTSLVNPHNLLLKNLSEAEEVRNRLAAIVDSSEDAIYGETPDGIVTTWNRGAQKIFGYAPKEIIGRPSGLLVPVKQKTEFDLILEEAARGERIMDRETVMLKKDGRPVDVSLTVSPFFDSSGTTLGMSTIARDVTERKTAERLREHAERVVRHDLKTPLNGIIGFAGILAEELEKPDLKQAASLILGSGYKMLHMVNHFLDLGKMEEGIYVLKSEKFNLVTLLKQLDREFAAIKNMRSLDIEYRLNNQPLNWNDSYDLVADKIHVQTMLSNLIVNALEASPENEKVTVTIASDNRAHRIVIHNKGTVPKQVKDRFFDRYATYGKRSGTGLGTYSARLIAKTHGGDITLDASDREVTLTVTLPKDIPLDIPARHDPAG